MGNCSWLFPLTHAWVLPLKSRTGWTGCLIGPPGNAQMVGTILIAPCLCLPGTDADWLLSILHIVMDKPDSVERWRAFCYKFRTSSFLLAAKFKLTML